MAGERETERRLGEVLTGWTPPPAPGPGTLEGRYARLERLSACAHGPDLYAAMSVDPAVWDYMPYGPFAREDDYRAWAAGAEASRDPLFYAIRDKDAARWTGVASWLRIAPEAGTIEVGHLTFAPALQGTRAATDAMALMMGWAFDAGYRRYEWKCNALNLPSRRAAERLGFSYEGTFRQATISKGRNRDTAWFAVIDKDWPALQAAFARWLDPANFDAGGRQRLRLSDLTRPIRVSCDPAL